MAEIVKYMALWTWEEEEQVLPEEPLDVGSEDEQGPEQEGVE